MKLAFQKDGLLLADIKTALANDVSRLWWLGQSGFLVAHGKRLFIFDPYLSDSLTHKYENTDKPHTRITEQVIDPGLLGELGVVAWITTSHNHTDHLDAKTLLPLLAANPQAKLILPAANRDCVLERLGRGLESRLVELDDGKSVEVGGVKLHGVAAAHNTVERDAAGCCRFLGYVAQWNGLTLYHSGDTLWHPGLADALKRFQIDVALLPINGTRPERRVAGNLDGREAAQLTHAIGARFVIPCHYDLFEFNTESPELFVSECRLLQQPYQVLHNGEGWDLPQP